MYEGHVGHHHRIGTLEGVVVILVSTVLVEIGSWSVSH